MSEDRTEDKLLSRQQRWAVKNPKAVWAQQALRSALKRGLLEQKPCEICGETQVDAHHPDYDRPMDVQWLCRLHHRQLHNEERKKRRAAA
ncbi:hypothetical protein [Mesorhizobium sp. 1B3]|uniref:hypothetical protein n=1 Tax=Mesorhizobium sp. 1B3 TaxID=3243599 RepID=UPI003D95933D